MLGAAARLGLITHRDSANGNRVGARGKDGRLIYAYGIDLSPLGLRYEEFMAAATKGAEADLRIKVLRQRLAAARRRIRTLAQLVDDERIDSIDARTAVEISLLATSQMRRVRDEELLSACVDQMEARADDLAKAVAVATQGFPDPLIPQKDSPSGDSDDAPITTTKQPKTAKAAYSNGYPEKSSRTEYDVRYQQPQTEVEADLAKHGVDPEFIAAVIPEFMLTTTSRPTWGDLINTAERLVDQAAIHRNVWHEACRLMGQKGAAASVIATAHKHMRGDVDRPGAYLRGMNKHAASGQLNLGRTYHGLKDSVRSEGMRSLATGSDSRSIGQLAAAALGLARAGRTQRLL